MHCILYNHSLNNPPLDIYAVRTSDVMWRTPPSSLFPLLHAITVSWFQVHPVLVSSDKYKRPYVIISVTCQMYCLSLTKYYSMSWCPSISRTSDCRFQQPAWKSVERAASLQKICINWQLLPIESFTAIEYLDQHSPGILLELHRLHRERSISPEHPTCHTIELWGLRIVMASRTANSKQWMLGSKFEQRMPHHNGIKELWETKWKFPVQSLHYAGAICYTDPLTSYGSARKVFIHSTMGNTRILNQYLGSWLRWGLPRFAEGRYADTLVEWYQRRLWGRLHWSLLSYRRTPFPTRGWNSCGG